MESLPPIPIIEIHDIDLILPKENNLGALYLGNI